MRDSILKGRARELRNQSTEAERALWNRLRQRRLLGLRFRRQVPIAGYIADFACIAARIVIELDGGQHHEAMDYDAHRDAAIRAAGYRALRFWNNQVLQQTESVLQSIVDSLEPPPP